VDTEITRPATRYMGLRLADPEQLTRDKVSLSLYLVRMKELRD